MKRTTGDSSKFTSPRPAERTQPTTPSKKLKSSESSKVKLEPGSETGSPGGGAKAKLPVEEKRAIAEEIIMKGIQAFDLEGICKTVSIEST